VLAAGAAGAWIGTAFAACTEAASSTQACEALLQAHDTDTVTTRVFDIAQAHPWPPQLSERVLRNDFVDRWDGHVAELAADRAGRAELADAMAAHDHRLAPVNAGQGVSMLTTVRPAADVMDQFCADARRLLDRW
jgi:nitronate monooxygenase